ncbi:hypothetical protein FHW36_11419 [Chitinophaga polysaccharea]|uniref:Uncharacterized protein n=1 Tax=Chitinophaga polysaccharea TaxID=1293035 RepID=A0A561P3E3_9BACT|nr:hypothetical protein FHW36_11419 [Chitinophaga polysaccharea]
MWLLLRFAVCLLKSRQSRNVKFYQTPQLDKLARELVILRGEITGAFMITAK